MHSHLQRLKSSFYRCNHLRAVVIAIRNFMLHRNNVECRCNIVELMYDLG